LSLGRKEKVGEFVRRGERAVNRHENGGWKKVNTDPGQIKTERLRKIALKKEAREREDLIEQMVKTSNYTP